MRWRRRDPDPLEAVLLEHPLRAQVVGQRAGLQPVQAELAERPLADQADGPGRHPAAVQVLGHEVAQVGAAERPAARCGRSRSRRPARRRPGSETCGRAPPSPAPTCARARSAGPRSVKNSSRPDGLERRQEAPLGGVERGQSAAASSTLDRAQSDLLYALADARPSVFKAYDVRGIVPDELDADGAYRLGRAYVAAFEPKSDGDRPRHATLLARPGRGASPGAPPKQGADVVELGQTGTEMLYFAVGEYGYEGGIQVTASHNPQQYNGMKIVRRGAQPVGGDTGLDEIKRAGTRRSRRRRPRRPAAQRTRDVSAGFSERVLGSSTRPRCGRCGSCWTAPTAWPGRCSSRCWTALPIDAVPCFMEPDGSFPHHEPNPLLEENREFIIGKVRQEGADLGIAWDGDADRCFFVDDTGEFVPGDLITALMAESMLRKQPGRDDHLRPARLVGGARHGRALRRHARSRTASATPSSRPACGRRTRSSRARSRATTTSATSTTATPGSSRRWCCWS